MIDDTAPSFCHYQTRDSRNGFLTLEQFQKGILYARKNNLSVLVLHPPYSLSEKYEQYISANADSLIVPNNISDDTDGDIVLFPRLSAVTKGIKDKNVILRISPKDFNNSEDAIIQLLMNNKRVSVFVDNIEYITEAELLEYKKTLIHLVDPIVKLASKGIFHQLNLITDLLMLSQMRNCNAGIEHITLAPNGKFYICPGFYYEDCSDYLCGDCEQGIKIKNVQLLQYDHAPICRHCDAYQCQRCLWLNKKMTQEINTPSHEQCVMSHLERLASRDLYLQLQQYRIRTPFKINYINKINYLDPFKLIWNRN